MINSSHLTVAVCGPVSSEALELFLEKNAASTKRDSDAELVLKDSPEGIILYWQRKHQQTLEYQIDIEKFYRRLKTYPAAKQAGLSQAIGRRTRRVIDATAGWGSDALLMCAQGYRVALIERNPIMALLLSDAMARLRNTSWAQRHAVAIPQVIEGDATEMLASGKLPADCVYLDPMFPSKRKKSAAANKNMQLLQRMVGTDDDAEQLLSTALAAGYARVVVKRPNYAQPLLPQPSAVFSSKLLHYDVYLSS